MLVETFDIPEASVGASQSNPIIVDHGTRFVSRSLEDWWTRRAESDSFATLEVIHLDA